MSSTIKTENLKLSQFQNADVPSWRTDYNSDMNKIDSAYAKSISGQYEENDIQNGDYFGFYDVSAAKNKKTLWSNILEKLGGVFSKNSQILSTVEECEASTENNNIAGASAIAELNSSLSVVDSRISYNNRIEIVNDTTIDVKSGYVQVYTLYNNTVSEVNDELHINAKIVWAQSLPISHANSLSPLYYVEKGDIVHFNGTAQEPHIYFYYCK